MQPGAFDSMACCQLLVKDNFPQITKCLTWHPVISFRPKCRANHKANCHKDIFFLSQFCRHRAPESISVKIAVPCQIEVCQEIVYRMSPSLHAIRSQRHQKLFASTGRFGSLGAWRA